MLYFVITIFAIALLISLCTMPLAMKLARAVGLVDKPDAVRKLHDKVTPLAGGLVVFVATVLSFILV
ncbi:MAG TPA: undecaprenyl/decaprenyl-phosphate alpha-N-acetylglucosaminyl 1-phosphate transferase, partial [Pirellulaceae bacterium]|nr:undecaprenyl/decaprenyl-phosphate alpha-N-acetylglucosaminyl 1-phosphate transferase [Pirellulaceae bacterium]